MGRKAVNVAIAICLAAALYAVLADNATADVIYLKNGNVIRGAITEQNESTVKITFGTVGEMTFTRDEIESIETDASDYQPLSTGGGPVETAPESVPQEDGSEPAVPEVETLTEADQVVLAENLAKLKTKDPVKWMEAQDALANMGSKVFGKLESELGTAQKPSQAAVLMSTMSRIDGKRAVEPIAARAADTNAMTRQAAVAVLGEIGDKRGAETLVACLADTKYYIRRDAAAALGKVADRRAIPALVQASNDNDPEVIVASMTALNKITKMQFSTGKEWQEWWTSQSAD
jgi:hypothetical protein